MKRSLFHHCIILLLSISISLSFPLSPDIKNAYVPPCVHCKHHKIENNKCMKFGTKDIVTNEATYDDARACRKDENKCGFDGLYFERVPNIQLKMAAIKLYDFTSDSINRLCLLTLFYFLLFGTVYGGSYYLLHFLSHL